MSKNRSEIEVEFYDSINEVLDQSKNKTLDFMTAVTNYEKRDIYNLDEFEETYQPAKKIKMNPENLEWSDVEDVVINQKPKPKIEIVTNYEPINKLKELLRYCNPTFQNYGRWVNERTNNLTKGDSKIINALVEQVRGNLENTEIDLLRLAIVSYIGTFKSETTNNCPFFVWVWNSNPDWRKYIVNPHKNFPNEKIPIVGSYIKLYSSYNERMNEIEKPIKITVDLFIEQKFKTYLYVIYKNIEKYDSDYTKFINDSEQFVIDGTNLPITNCFGRYLTGTAACGKTTILTKLQDKGYCIYNRGTLGSFAGKATNPIEIAGLHAAIQCASSIDGWIGDRGQIDNPLWRGIMECCDEKFHKNPHLLVSKIYELFESLLNIYTYNFYKNSRVAVLIDVKHNFVSERLLKRGEGGDYQRARIPYYSLTQNMFYLAAAKLFGWKLYTVPYIEGTKQISKNKMINIARELSEYFGPTSTSYVIKASKPKNYESDMEFAKQCGIFK